MAAGDKLSVYVENRSGAAGWFLVSQAALRKALGPHAERADITVCTSEKPDFAVLAAAEFFIGSGFDPERLKQHAESLRVVHCLSAGVDYYLPLDWLRPGALLTNSSGAHEEKGGQYGLMAVLMLNERVPRHVTSQRHRLWCQTFSSSIRGKTALFFGTGALGGAIAACLRSIGVRCIGFSRSGEPNGHFDGSFKATLLREWLPQADFLVVAAPLTDETRGAIGAREIALLPARAGIVNIGRAPVIDHNALCAALREDRLSGAVLDVFDPEPLPADSNLWETPNLVITPHTSCDDHDSHIDRCLAIFAENFDRLVRGLPLRNVVDPELQY